MLEYTRIAVTFSIRTYSARGYEVGLKKAIEVNDVRGELVSLPWRRTEIMI
jgi:hypothetical protein